MKITYQCRCGEELLTKMRYSHLTFQGTAYVNFEYYCPNSKWYNFWNHKHIFLTPQS